MAFGGRRAAHVSNWDVSWKPVNYSAVEIPEVLRPTAPNGTAYLQKLSRPVAIKTNLNDFSAIHHNRIFGCHAHTAIMDECERESKMALAEACRHEFGTGDRSRGSTTSMLDKVDVTDVGDLRDSCLRRRVAV